MTEKENTQYWARKTFSSFEDRFKPFDANLEDKDPPPPIGHDEYPLGWYVHQSDCVFFTDTAFYILREARTWERHMYRDIVRTLPFEDKNTVRWVDLLLHNGSVVRVPISGVNKNGFADWPEFRRFLLHVVAHQ
ncbi:hypothetical protein [Polyangium jinanense]|uniref:hypothetical protein n=1 Tax=Polyangium jinanense TaxID=2829994 RepID=UPI002341FDE7|nr:hypothetical protein [Polyangium jinanense]